MRHFGQVGDHRRSGDVLAQGNRQAGSHPLKSARLQDGAQANQRRLAIGHFNSHKGLPGDGGLDAQRRGRECQRQVVGQARDLRHAHLVAAHRPVRPGLLDGAWFERVLRHRRPGPEVDHPGRQPELRQGLLDQSGGLVNLLGRNLSALAPAQQIQGGQARVPRLGAGHGSRRPLRQLEVFAELARQRLLPGRRTRPAPGPRQNLYGRFLRRLLRCGRQGHPLASP